VYFYSSLVVCGEPQDIKSGKSLIGNPASKKVLSDTNDKQQIMSGKTPIKIALIAGKNYA